MKHCSTLRRRTAALAAGTLLALGAASASATLCGTLAAPTSCSLTVGGTTTYTVTGLELVAQFAAGPNANLYGAADVGVELLPTGGLGATLRFTHASTSAFPGPVFFANPDDISAFSFQYQLAVTAAAPGSVHLTDSYLAAVVGSDLGNGTFSVNSLITSGLSQTSCLLHPSLKEGNCLMPQADLTALEGKLNVSINGNDGNASLLQMDHAFNAIFTAEGTNPNPVPEPAAPALAAAALLGLAWQRRRHPRG